MDYIGWNNAVAAHFFNTQSAHRPVHLYVTQELLNEIGRPHGCDSSSFIQQVLVGPGWISDGRLSLCGKAYRTYDGWRNISNGQGYSYPPYLGYLALFVFAAGVEGGFAPHAYYPRLRRLLGEPEDTGAPSGFDRMWELWVDLEEWSKSDKDGELGTFNFYFSGGWQHVGLPIGQTLLSEEDRRNLLSLFASHALDPNSPPSDTEVLALLRDSSSGVLQRRTQRLLMDGADPQARRALVQVVVAELTHWDGMTDGPTADMPTPTTLAALRLCCRYDPIAAKIEMRLRCKTAQPFPDAALNFSGSQLEQPVSCEEEGSEWSTELTEAESHVPLDASALPWTTPLEFEDETHSWRAAMSGSPIRLFVSGSEFGLPGFVEMTRLSRGAQFLIAAHEHVEQIELWGRNSCIDFQELRILSGLPRDWRLFSARRAEDDSNIRNLIPRLALPSSLRVSFKGGLRTQEGSASRYFAFALPSIEVDSPSADITVFCNGIQLVPSPGSLSYSLPPDLPVDVLLRIEAKSLAGDVARLTLVIASNVFPRWQEQTMRFGPLGNQVASETSGMLGALVESATEDFFNFGNALPPIPAAKAYLIGKIPGQISIWPQEGAPVWQPMWAVAVDRRKGLVVPCLIDYADSEPTAGRYGDHSALKSWKKVIWHWRKRITPPGEIAYAKLWARYKEAARNV